MNLERKDWVILRCSGASTLKLASSLAEAGFEVWTPSEERRKRKPGSRLRRTGDIPVMPTYVFAAAKHLHTLIAEAEKQTSDHPHFSLFKHFGRIPLIADGTLDPLRVAERKGQKLENVHRFTPGEIVRCAEAGFQGLSGVVELTKGQFTLVSFPGFSMPIKIRSFLLLSDVAKAELPDVRRAA